MFFLLGEPCKQCHYFFLVGEHAKLYRLFVRTTCCKFGGSAFGAENQEIGGLVIYESMICQIQLLASYYFPSQYQSVVEGKRHHLQNK